MSIFTNDLILLCYLKICLQNQDKYNFLNDNTKSKLRTNMNSSFVCISILVKSRLPRNFLVNHLNETSSQSLRSYLRLANIYDGNSNQKKSDLIEMIIFGCMNGKLKNVDINDISNNKLNTILKEKEISIKSLPGYGNLGLRKRDLKSYEENENCSIKLKDQYVILSKINSYNSF